MTEEHWIALIGAMQMMLDTVNELKNSPDADGRSLSIAATHLETAMLWVANAKK